MALLRAGVMCSTNVFLVQAGSYKNRHQLLFVLMLYIQTMFCTKTLTVTNEEQTSTASIYSLTHYKLTQCTPLGRAILKNWDKSRATTISLFSPSEAYTWPMEVKSRHSIPVELSGLQILAHREWLQ